MITLNLSREDRDILIRVLDEYYSELRMEISNTENWEFKKGLKEEESTLLGILTQLRESQKSKSKGG
jgi:hypothetical protein